MDRYIPRPPQVEAIQLTEANWPAIQALLDPVDDIRTITAAETADTCGDPGPEYRAVTVTTLYGEQLHIVHGEWIVIHAPRTFVRYTPEGFAAAYEPA